MGTGQASQVADGCAAHPGARLPAPRVPGIVLCSALHSGLREHASAEMSETGRTVLDMHESLSRYDVTVTVGYEGGSSPDPAAFAAAADQAARRRSATIISAHLADTIISVVTVVAPDRYAAVAVARAAVADALKGLALSSSQFGRQGLTAQRG